MLASVSLHLGRGKARALVINSDDQHTWLQNMSAGTSGSCIMIQRGHATLPFASI